MLQALHTVFRQIKYPSPPQKNTQHLGQGVPQVLATFLAFGEFTNFLRLGFLRYWQRHGFCSLILEQQSLVGGDEDVIALTHALSCTGLHVTAIDTCTSARSSTKSAHKAICDFFIFPLKGCLKLFVNGSKRDSQMLLLYWSGAVWVVFIFLYLQSKLSGKGKK